MPLEYCTNSVKLRVGWTNRLHKTAKPVKNEQLSLSEAFHILNHISHRYHQRQLTQFFLSFAHDKEFRLILQQGLKSLQTELDMLEKEAMKFEVALPSRPPSSVAVKMDPETMEDSFMYNTILKGIQDALDLHTRAAVEVIRNDPLRTQFFDLHKKELDLYDNFVRYGKLKGWTGTVPIYTESC